MSGYPAGVALDSAGCNKWRAGMRRISHPGCIARDRVPAGDGEADHPAETWNLAAICCGSGYLDSWTNPLNSGTIKDNVGGFLPRTAVGVCSKLVVLIFPTSIIPVGT